MPTPPRFCWRLETLPGRPLIADVGTPAGCADVRRGARRRRECERTRAGRRAAHDVPHTAGRTQPRSRRTGERARPPRHSGAPDGMPRRSGVCTGADSRTAGFLAQQQFMVRRGHTRRACPVRRAASQSTPVAGASALTLSLPSPTPLLFCFSFRPRTKKSPRTFEGRVPAASPQEASGAERAPCGSMRGESDARDRQDEFAEIEIERGPAGDDRADELRLPAAGPRRSLAAAPASRRLHSKACSRGGRARDRPPPAHCAQSGAQSGRQYALCSPAGLAQSPSAAPLKHVLMHHNREQRSRSRGQGAAAGGWLCIREAISGQIGRHGSVAGNGAPTANRALQRTAHAKRSVYVVHVCGQEPTCSSKAGVLQGRVETRRFIVRWLHC